MNNHEPSLANLAKNDSQYQEVHVFKIYDYTDGQMAFAEGFYKLA